MKNNKSFKTILFISIILTVFMIVLIGYWNTPKYQKETEKAISIVLKVQRNELTEESAVLNLTNILSDYTQNNNFINSLKYFAHKTSSISLNSIEINEALDEPGNSCDRVFVVLNKENDSPFKIIKTFKKNSINFFPEIFALDYLQKAKIQDFSSPKIEALGRCRIGEIDYFLLSESVAAGQSLLNHYKNNKNFKILSRGIYKCGYSLAKLHLHATGSPQGLPLELEKRTREYLDMAIKNLQTYPVVGINPLKIPSVFEKIVLNIQAEPLATAVIHGDTKFINVFYDPKTDVITWIDPPKLSNSINSLGQPIGIPAKDFNSFFADIENQNKTFLIANNKVCSKDLYSSQDINILKDLFIAGYQDGGGKLPTKNQKEFFSFAGNLYYIAFDKTRDASFTIQEPLRSFKIYKMDTIFHKMSTQLQSY